MVDMENFALKAEADDISLTASKTSEGQSADLVDSVFKARMAQFKYSPLKDAGAVRRSPRIAGPQVPALSKSPRASPSSKKRPFPEGDEKNGIKIEQELDTESMTDHTPAKSKKRRSTTKE